MHPPMLDRCGAASTTEPTRASWKSLSACADGTYQGKGRCAEDAGVRAHKGFEWVEG